MMWKEATSFRKLNILNLEYAQFPGVGPYDIPAILPEKDLPEITEWVGFNYATQGKDLTGKGVHFFLDDYQFERVWKTPGRYIDMLSKAACVASPDFSPYGDMPLAAQIWNHYRKHWVARYWQEYGITVIPTIRASSDPRSLEWYLDGEPAGGAVIMSSMWTKKQTPHKRKMDIEEYRRMKETLNPNKIYIYGGETDGMGVEPEDPVTYIPGFVERRLRK